jgi:hypothetical protein
MRGQAYECRSYSTVQQVPLPTDFFASSDCGCSRVYVPISVGLGQMAVSTRVGPTSPHSYTRPTALVNVRICCRPSAGGRRSSHPAEPPAISKDHSSLLTPTGGGAAPPPRSAAERCPCPNAGECSHASKAASSRQRVSTSQVVRSSVGLRSSKPSKPSWSSTAPARAANRRASSSPLSAGTVIALIFTTVICPMMPAHLIARHCAFRPAAALQPGPRSATAARAAAISVRWSSACRIAIWASRPARPLPACRSAAVQPATSWLMAGPLRRKCSAASLPVTAIGLAACPALSASTTSEFTVTVTAAPADRPAVQQVPPGQGDPAEHVVPLLRRTAALARGRL